MDKILTTTGSKAMQRSDNEWRSRPYSEWHRKLGRSYYSSDVDSIEWRFVDGELKAVGVMEITRVDDGITVGEKYLSSILDRFINRDLQSKTATRVAEVLNTKVYIILFRENCKEFWLYNLTDRKGWTHLNEYWMSYFIRNLK